jgi:hypothetical protein
LWPSPRRCTGTCPAEETLEYVVDPETKALKTTASHTPILDAGVSKTIITSPFIRVTQDLIGFIDLFEPLLGPRFLVHVWVVLAR